MRDNFEHLDKKHIAEIMDNPKKIQLATKAIDDALLMINIHEENAERLKEGIEETNSLLQAEKEKDNEVKRSEAREKNIKLLEAKKYQQKLQGMNPFRRRFLKRPK